MTFADQINDAFIVLLQPWIKLMGEFRRKNCHQKAMGYQYARQSESEDCRLSELAESPEDFVV
jgi:hypothetical protein